MPVVSIQPQTGTAPAPPAISPEAHALKTFECAAQSHPRDAKAQARYGTALVESGAPGQGIARLRRAVALDPKLTAAWHNLGRASEQQGWIDAAADSYEHVVAAMPDNAGEWIKLGYCDIQLHRFPEAERAMKRALVLEPSSPAALIAVAAAQ